MQFASYNHRAAIIVALLMLLPAITAATRAADNTIGTKWGSPEFGTGAVVTWGLESSGSGILLDGHMPTGYKEQVRAAFDVWSEVANITFVEIDDVGGHVPDIRIGGHTFDGLGGTAAHAYYPSSAASAGDIHFDIGEDWTLEYGNISRGLIKQNVFSVTMHEIGHSIGLTHIDGVFSVMNTPPSTTEFFQGLMPVDIESAQTVYGPAPGYQPPPAANSTLTLTPNSSLQFTISLFDGTIAVSDTTQLSGTLSAWVDQGAAGAPGALAIRDSTIAMSNMTMSHDGDRRDLHRRRRLRPQHARPGP